MTVTPDPAARTLAHYTPEPGEDEYPEVVFCWTAGDVRMECVSGCTYDCWHAEYDHHPEEQEWPITLDAVTLVQITPF